MTIEQGLSFFKELNTKNPTKKELRVYNTFISVLTDLKNRDLTPEQILDIEAELTHLDIKEKTNDIKNLRKKLNGFICFIKKKLSLISEGQYMGLGMAIGLSLGMSLGMTFGIIFSKDNGMILGMNIGMGIGMALGMIIGAAKDAELKKQGKVLNTKP
ncbi:hypothetical protein [uncultured Lacinutrix sp.]|uniref:hypothetical protein n=1 Tax=uncultured Lacinutrix sp. TaxID=574032 RepID=UPI0026362188|nr:hypothetical protein [uncultured Lacinutrix sp.]